MRGVFRRLPAWPAGQVELCERCGQVCEDRRRAKALLEQIRTRAATGRVGF